MAYRQAELPYYAVAEPVTNVTLPSFARMKHQGEDVMRAFFGSLKLVALAVVPLGVVLSAAAAPFTEALFGPKWPPMIGPLAVLGIWAAIRPLEKTVATLLNSTGHAGFVGRLSLLLLPPQVVGIYLAAEYGDITTVAWVMLGHIVLSLALVMGMVQRVTGHSVPRQLAELWPLLAAALVAWALTRLLAGALDEQAPALALIACGAAALSSYLVTIRLLAPTLLRDGWATARRALTRPGDAG
jgi:O-antigen/teichoic acid export membrane protein